VITRNQSVTIFFSLHLVCGHEKTWQVCFLK
jgi:hypothetical protein